MSQHDERHLILELLDAYQRDWVDSKPNYVDFDLAQSLRTLTTIREFVQSTPDCFRREHEAGHITGSAMVVDKSLSRVLLTLHAKLDRWLQLGGHSDGDPVPYRVAMREAEEESGMTALSFFQGRKIPYDVDVHEIPATPKEPSHYHYDLRFLIVAEHPESIQISEESKQLQWFSLEQAMGLTSEKAMTRQFEKIAYLRNHLNK